MTSQNLLSIGSKRCFTIRWYGDSHWGWRNLGGPRYCLDVWRLGFLFERYP